MLLKEGNITILFEIPCFISLLKNFADEMCLRTALNKLKINISYHLSCCDICTLLIVCSFSFNTYCSLLAFFIYPEDGMSFKKYWINFWALPKSFPSTFVVVLCRRILTVNLYEALIEGQGSSSAALLLSSYTRVHKHWLVAHHPILQLPSRTLQAQTLLPRGMALLREKAVCFTCPFLAWKGIEKQFLVLCVIFPNPQQWSSWP